MKKMRAKLVVNHIAPGSTSERLSFNAVAASAYPSDGSDEDNTYAKWSPSAEFGITITNPALIGQFLVGEKYYVDFTPADSPMPIQMLDTELPETSKGEPRVTPERIEEVIVNTEFYVFPGTTVTVCLLTLKNGAKVLGHNYGSIDPEKQDWHIADLAARDMAVEKVGELEGYALRERMHQDANLRRRPNPAHGAPKPAGHNPVA